MSLRILFLGENWYGSCARACCYALRRLGCDVTDLDHQAIFPNWQQRSNRAIRRLLHPRIVREYNQLILECASQIKPDIFLAFKGQCVKSSTLEVLRKSRITLYNYYPDTSLSTHGSLLAESIRRYDRVFYTKKFWNSSPPEAFAGVPSTFLPHGFDPEVHRMLPLDPRDVADYGHDVTVIGSHTPHKERLLSELLRRSPNLDLRIYGDRWMESSRSPEIKPHLRGFALFGSQYAKAIRGAHISLALMSGKVEGVVQGDETTTRTFEIPACGGFMLHERTPELLELYREGKEVACFGSIEELASKIEYYLARPEEREAITHAGHLRCVPAYSYDQRMKEILKYHAPSCRSSLGIAN